MSRGMTVDVSFHEKEHGDGGTPNPHFHFLCPIRPIEQDGKWGLKQRRVYGFTAQSLPVLVHGVQSMQNLKPAKEFRALIANEESLDALLEIKGHLEYYLPEESGNDKRALAYLWRDVLWAIWGTASENGGSKVIKTAPKELKEKYQQVFA